MLSFFSQWIYIFNPHPRICLLILEKRGRGRRKKGRGEREKYQLVASCMHPDWESHPQPFGVWDDAPTNWVTGPGLYEYFDRIKNNKLYKQNRDRLIGRGQADSWGRGGEQEKKPRKNTWTWTTVWWLRGGGGWVEVEEGMGNKWWWEKLKE